MRQTGEILRAVNYLRYSDHKQDGGTSIETQKDACDKYIEEHGFVFVADYCDAAKTASKGVVGRSEFLKMLQDAKKGLFDVVLIFKFSRVFRNQYEAHVYEHELQKSGVRLLSVTEPIADTLEGRLMKGVIHAFNEFTSSTISAHVAASMLTLARKGYFLGSVPLFGYDATHDGKEGRRYTINEHEAPIVRELFDLFAGGLSLGEIAKRFHACGYRTRKYKKRGGRPFGEKTLRDMLTNEHYRGVYLYASKDGDRVRRENNHPAIISEAVWYQVQDRLAASTETNKKRRTNKRRTFFLSGRVVCEYCGASCTGSTSRWTYKGVQHLRPYYHCQNRRQSRGDCPAQTVRKDALEAFVFGAIRQYILNDAAIAQISALAARAAAVGDNSPAAQLDALKIERDALLARLSAAMDSTLNTDLPPAARSMWNRKVETIARELETIEINIKRATHAAENAVSEDAVAAYLRDLLEKMNDDENDRDVRALLVEAFVERVTVSNDKVAVYLAFSFGQFSAYSDGAGFPVFRQCAETKKRDL